MCIELNSAVVHGSNFNFGFIRSDTNGVSVAVRPNNSGDTHADWNEWWRNKTAIAVQTVGGVAQWGEHRPVIWGNDTHISYGSNPFSGRGNIGGPGWKLIFSINMSNQQITIRYLNASGNDHFSPFVASGSTLNLSSWITSGFKYYPYVCFWDNNGTQFKFDKNQTISGQTNIFDL